METDLTGDEVNCKVCGKSCRECGSALWKTAYKCEDCGVKYFDRTEYNNEYTQWGRRIGRDVVLE